MSNSNFIIIGGRLAKDPELRYTNTGLAICKFTLALNHSKDKVSFIDCTAWNDMAKMISQKKKKGDYLKISGTIRQETWQDKQTGQNKSKISITANEIMVTFPSVNYALNNNQQSQNQTNIQNNFDGEIVDNEDIPF
jgi:single-strand DNA-binding protein